MNLKPNEKLPMDIQISDLIFTGRAKMGVQACAVLDDMLKQQNQLIPANLTSSENTYALSPRYSSRDTIQP